MIGRRKATPQLLELRGCVRIDFESLLQVARRDGRSDSDNGSNSDGRSNDGLLCNLGLRFVAAFSLVSARERSLRHIAGRNGDVSETAHSRTNWALPAIIEQNWIAVGIERRL